MIKLLSFADVISITNAVFGVLAVLVLFTNINFKIHLSLSLIFLGLLADGLDGILARYAGKSDIGEYLEAMADMTTMVVAPAVFIFFVYMDALSSEVIRQVFLFVALILFFSFGIVRLASFNIMKKKNIYVGLPASASAIILLILSFFEVELMIILFATVVIGALMASDIVFPKPGKTINAAAFVLILLTIVFGKSYYGFAPILLFCAIMIYTFGGPIYKKFLEKSR